MGANSPTESNESKESLFSDRDELDGYVKKVMVKNRVLEVLISSF